MNEETTEPLPQNEPTLTQLLMEIREVKSRIESLEDKFDARSRETRPMSERIDQIVAAIAETRQEVAEVRQGVAEARQELAETRTELTATRTATRQELRDINRTLRGINLPMSRAAWVHDDLETRIEKLENQAVTETSLQS